MKPEKWDIWLVDMPFDEGKESKIRPVLVIEQDDSDPVVLVGKMTTHAPREHFQNEYALQNWQGAGLHKATTLRLHQIYRIDEKRFLKRIGQLKLIDIISVDKILKTEKRF